MLLISRLTGFQAFGQGDVYFEGAVCDLGRTGYELASIWRS